MYFKQHLTDLVRLFGNSEIPLPEAREKLKPLVDKYGKELMESAAEEIIFIDGSHDHAIARLTDDARKLAVQLIGRPPATTASGTRQTQNEAAEEGDGNSRNGTPQIQDNASSANSVTGQSHAQTAKSEPLNSTPHRLGRKKALVHFREWLIETKQPFATADHAQQVQSSGAKFGTLDFILYGEPVNRLVTVRNKLTAVQRHDMQEWQRIFGTDFQATRAWPEDAPDGSSWQFHSIE